MKVAGLLEELRATFDRRRANIVHYDSAVDKFKASKDNTAFQAQTKKLNADYTAASQKINAIGAALVKEDGDLSEKVLPEIEFLFAVSISWGSATGIFYNKLYLNPVYLSFLFIIINHHNAFF